MGKGKPGTGAVEPGAATRAAHRDAAHVAATGPARETGGARVGLNASDKEKKEKESPAERGRRKEKEDERAK